MTTTARLDSPRVELSPGGQVVVPLHIRNTGQTVEGYRIEVLGAPASWATVEPAVIDGLYPDTSTTATITFAPPRSSAVPAGPLDFGVRVVPFEHVEETVTPEGVVEVLPFLDTTAELLPRTSHGRRGAKHRVALDNRGNVPVTVALTAADEQQKLDFRVQPQLLTVAPGTAAFGDVRVKPVRSFWRGTDVTHPFTVTASAENTTPVLLDGAHVQTAILPKWFLKALLALLLLLAALVLAWFTLLKPAITSAAKSSVADEVQEAKDAASAAQEAATQAQQGSAAAAQQAQAAQEQAAKVEDLTANLPITPSEVFTPTLQRLAAVNLPPNNVATPVTPAFTVPDGATLRVTDLVLNNPQGDFGRLVLTQVIPDAPDAVLIDVALENFRDADYHFQTPIIVPSGNGLQITVTCRTVGTPADNTAPPAACNDALVFSGQVVTPAPAPAP